MRFHTCNALLLLSLIPAASIAAEPIVNPDCRSQYCVKPSQILAAPEAIALKRANPRRTLLVDVRSHAEAHFTGVPLGVDAHIPFAEPIGKLGANELEMLPRMEFAHRVDDLLMSRRMQHGESVILICSNGEDGLAAAVRLQEWGYDNVSIVRDGFDGRLVKRDDGTYARSGGWKNLGLPWNAFGDTSPHAQTASLTR